jgi:hypothetical protein
MKHEPTDRARGTLTKGPDRKTLPRDISRNGAPADAPPSPLAPLEPGSVAMTAASTPRPRHGKLATATALVALSIAAASLMILRPMAQTDLSKVEIPTAPAHKQPSGVTGASYTVRVGPYRAPKDVLSAHKRLLALGFQPLLIRGADGTYLRALLAPTEREATRIAQGLREQGFSALVMESAPEADLIRGRSGDPEYHVDGVLVDFEGGQTKGWDGAGSITSVRNSSLFSFHGKRSLEASLHEMSLQSPGQLRFKPESVVLSQDVFVARILLPNAADVHVGVRWYVVDANGKRSRTSGLPLRPGQWIATRYALLPQVMLPIQELGLEFISPKDTSWSGVLYVDNVEQQRAR